MKKGQLRMRRVKLPKPDFYETDPHPPHTHTKKELLQRGIEIEIGEAAMVQPDLPPDLELIRIPDQQTHLAGGKASFSHSVSACFHQTVKEA
jgi:hypothetical protein